MRIVLVTRTARGGAIIVRRRCPQRSADRFPQAAHVESIALLERA